MLIALLPDARSSELLTSAIPKLGMWLPRTVSIMPLEEDDTSWQVLSSFSAPCGVFSSAELETDVELHVVVCC
jgi:hypothetical protein